MKRIAANLRTICTLFSCVVFIVALVACQPLPRPADDSGEFAPYPADNDGMSIFTNLAKFEPWILRDCNKNGQTDIWEISPALFTLGPANDYTVGENPSSAATGDLNNDGHLDLAVTNRNDDTVSILLNDGEGMFRISGAFPTGGDQPAGVTIAHLNGDGHLDLAIANYNDGTVSVLYGNGDGTFSTAESFVVFESDRLVTVAGVAALDLDVSDGEPDRTLDLVAIWGVAGYSNNLTILRNGDNGSPRFETSLLMDGLSITGDSTALAVADLDLDGDQDVVVGSSYGGLTLVANNIGTLTTVRPEDGGYIFSPDGGRITSITVADVKGDRFPDLIIAKPGSNIVTILPTRMGDPATSLEVDDIQMGNQPKSVIVVDLDGDGVLDIATANLADNEIAVRLGKGDETYETPRTYEVGTSPQILLAAEMDGHRQVDLLTANSGREGIEDEEDNVSVLLSGARTSLDCNANQVPDGCDIGGNASNDCNSNGIPDACDIDTNISFSPRIYGVPLPAGITYLPRIAAIKGNGDAHLDLVLVDLLSNQRPKFLLGLGDGMFEEDYTFQESFPDGAGSVAVAKLGNSDGDIALANTFEGWVKVYWRASDNSWNTLDSNTYESSDFILGLFAAELTGDSFDELIVLHSDKLVLIRNDGPYEYSLHNPRFTVGPEIPLSGSPTSMTTSDLDGDGDLDLIIGKYSEGEVEVCRNDSTGDELVFSDCSEFNADINVTSVAAGRLHDEGELPAIAATNDETTHISILRNLKAPASSALVFEDSPPVAQSVGPYGRPRPWDLLIHDFDGDNDQDIAISNSSNDIVSVLRNDGAANFTPFGFRTGDRPLDIILVDLDGDDKQDIAAANGSGEITVLINRSQLPLGLPDECSVD